MKLQHQHEQTLVAAGVASVFVLLALLVPALTAQTAPPEQASSERPVPILTGNAGFFTILNAGQFQLVPAINPVVLVPLGDRWLIESKAEFTAQFEPAQGGGSFGGKVENEIPYVQLDYIANPYVTITVGRFLTPFAIYNERLYPIWIRSLHQVPLIFPIGTGSSDGVMLRGGFPVSARVNLNYAAYFSTLSTVHKLDSDRKAGGRLGLFVPQRRIEAGFSWQKLLQEARSNSFGFHFSWQPMQLPLTLRSEYARSQLGSGYWIEGGYRLSQLHFWEKAMRRTEVVARAQQLFAGNISSDVAKEYGLPHVDTRQADFGINYYLQDGLKATTSYGRQSSSAGDFSLWTAGIAYRFAFPLGRVGAQ